MSIDEQLESDRVLYWVSFERLVDGKRERLDPTTIKMVTVTPKISFYPKPPENSDLRLQFVAELLSYAAPKFSAVVGATDQSGPNLLTSQNDNL